MAKKYHSLQQLKKSIKKTSAIKKAVFKTKKNGKATKRKKATTPRQLTKEITSLYLNPLSANRSGPLFNAFPYPTKISPEAIALYIAAHTQPGDTIFDGFAGSGTTGLAALLCEDPSPALEKEAKRLGLNVKWGARNAVLCELSSLGAFVGKTLTNPPNPKIFFKAAKEILATAERDIGWMYEAADLQGKTATIRYIVWSDLLQCKTCQHQVTFWEAFVSKKPAQIKSKFVCSACSFEGTVNDVDRVTERVHDEVLGKNVECRSRRPIWIYGATGTKKWSRPVTDKDLKVLKRIQKESIPTTVPKVKIPWGDLYRNGYHQGITHLHHFYTRRNLIVFSRLWELTGSYNSQLRDALRFWLLSYNSSHATIMTRVVAKSGQKDLVITSAQPGVLYISGLPVEKNLISGLARKLSTITKAFTQIYGRKGKVEVLHQSSCHLNIPDQSIDYVFTDPPFGGNIPYAEINFLNEAWLNRYTDRTEEAIVSNNQGKEISDYQELLTSALSEVSRVLKRKGKATLVFHSATAEVWNALQASYTKAGLGVECAGILDKTQGSFKQVTTVGAVSGDPILMLSKESFIGQSIGSVWDVAKHLQEEAMLALDPRAGTPQRLYSRLVSHYLSLHQKVPIDADSFYQWHTKQRTKVYANAKS